MIDIPKEKQSLSAQTGKKRKELEVNKAEYLTEERISASVRFRTDKGNIDLVEREREAVKGSLRKNKKYRKQNQVR